MAQDLDGGDLPRRLAGAGRGAAILCGVLVLLGGCLPPSPVGSVATPVPAVDAVMVAFAADAPEVALPAMIQAERNAAAAGDLALLGELWHEDAQIVETRGTDETGDDYIFDGRAAILDRYRVAVAQHPPAALDAPPDVEVRVEADGATIINGVDTWTFTREENRWWIQSLTISP